MKYYQPLFLLLSLATSFLLAQEYTIQGTVVTTDSTPIVFANVVLLTEKDSTIIKGTTTDEGGIFFFQEVRAGNFIVKASYLGNVSKPLEVNLSENINIGDITISELEELDEVVVTYKKPTLERKVDRLVFNVSNTALADGSLWDLLKQTPSVSVVQDVLSIKGSKNVGVLINGRKVNLPESDIINLLSGTSASNVEAIEVITNPPLKYSAEGGMLIDIKMKKNLVAGYNGAVFNNFSQGVFPKNTTGTDHYFKGKKTDFSVNYSFSTDKRIFRYTDRTSFFNNTDIVALWTANQDLTTRRKKHNVSAFFDYEINDKNVVSVSTINVFNPSVDRFSYSETNISDMNDAPVSSFITINRSDQEQINSSFYLDWNHKLKKEGGKFSVGSHYTIYDSKRGQDLNTDFLNLNNEITGSNDFTTQSDQKINLYNIEIDLTYPLDQAMRLETGLRYAGINAENTINQEGFDRNQPGINPTEAGIFLYDESIYAAYGSLDGKWNLWNLKTGFRAEYTETKGDLNITEGAKENSYLELFPSIALQYIPNKTHQYKFSYFRRIQRPRYSDINPFQYFESNNIVREGNPDLLPGTRDWVSVEYTYDRDYSLTFFYLKWKNPSQQLVFQDNENNLLRYISSNLETRRGYGIDLVINKDLLDVWNVYTFFSCYNSQSRFADLDSGEIVSNSLWTGFLRLSNNFTFLKDKSLVADMTFEYNSPRVLGNSRRESFHKLNMQLRKTLWNKKASLSLGIDDIFNQGNQLWSRDYLNQKNSNFNRFENRLLHFGFRYKFGNVRIRGNKKSKRVEERRRI